MRIPTRLLSAAIAGIVTSGLAASPALAKGRKPEMSDSKMEKKMATDQNSCKGMNGCKGKEGSMEHSCKGMNECKGKGGCKTESHACKGMNECKGQGGCKS